MTSRYPPLHITGCPHRPTRMQAKALKYSLVPEILYGGSAGGGKTDWLLMEALQFIGTPGYSAIIFRRTFPQLSAPEDGLLARALEWLGPNKDFNGYATIGSMPTRWKHRTGGTLSFSHLQAEKDKYNHQGPSYQFIGWDELTQFSASQYRYLVKSRMRRLASQSWLPLRARAGSNPGGDGHDWVREYFPVPHNGKVRPMADRLFIPARLSDNPYLDQEQYAESLRDMHPHERAQLLEGNWDARPPGSRFKREWFTIIDEAPAGMEEVRRWDLAATEPKAGADPDYSVGVLMGRSSNGSLSFVISDVQRFRENPGPTEQRIAQTAAIDGRGVSIRMEQEPGASGKIVVAQFARLLEGYDFKGVSSTGDKVVRSNPIAAAAERGEVALVSGPWVEEFLRELESFGGTEGQSHDDQVDAASGAHTDLTYRRGATPADLYGEDAHAVSA